MRPIQFFLEKLSIKIYFILYYSNAGSKLIFVDIRNSITLSVKIISYATSILKLILIRIMNVPQIPLSTYAEIRNVFKVNENNAIILFYNTGAAMKVII